MVWGLSGIRELFSNQNAKPSRSVVLTVPHVLLLAPGISGQGQGENLGNDLLHLPAVGGTVGGRISTAVVLG